MAAKKEAKIITINHKGEDYKLRYTKRTAKMMEDSGFSLDQVKDKPMMLYDLFEGAFLAEHRNIKRDLVREIFDSLPGKEKLYEKLYELYQEPFEFLVAEPDEDAEGNATWGASW